MGASNSALAVFPIQDVLALGEAFKPAKAAEERINVPGSVNDWNWGWRLPATLEAILADSGLAKAAKAALARKARP